MSTETFRLSDEFTRLYCASELLEEAALLEPDAGIVRERLRGLG